MNLKDAVNYEYSEQDMIKPLKNITLSEADSTETFNFKPFEYERGTVTKTTKGVINTIRDMQDIPEQVKIFGKRISFGFGGYFGDTEEETERKKLNLVTAERNLNEAQAERYKYTSPKETESLSYGIGGGVVNYGTMLVPAGLVGGGLKAAGAGAKAISTGAEIAGLGTMSVMELAGQVQDKTPEKDGKIDIEAMTPEWARKATGGTIAYTGLSALTEKYVGFGKQMKMWNKPIQWGGNVTSKALTTLRTAGTNALSEGATEGIQDLEATGIGLIDGTLTMDKLPARLQQAWKSAIIGGIIGGGVGTAAAMKSARNVKKQLREMVAPVVGEKDANTVAEAIYNAGTDDMTKAISIELELSSELKNKHGKVWNSMLTAVTKEMEGKPRFDGWSEDQKAHYANTVAKHFADQTLAEANFRGTTLDAILRASDITWNKGIRLARHINLFDALKNPEMIPPETKLKRESLLAFLKRNGGLQDYGGELKSRDAQKLYPGIVNKNGMNFDDAALMAWENGYFPSKTERPDINEFLEAVDEGLRGNHRYNTEEERNFSDAIEDLREELDRLGIDYENMTAAEIEKAVDEIPELKSLEREAAFYEQYEPEIGLSEDEAERLAIETEGKQYPIIEDKDLPEYYQIADENAQLDAENPAYDGETITINGKEKTVYNSNGDRIAKSKEALENFYKWFGDSKVVDEYGKPLVVYHGTNTNFDVFDNTKSQRKVSSYNTIENTSYFTSSNNNALTYGSNIFPVYLSIKKPLIIDYNGKHFNDIINFDDKTFGKKGFFAKDDIDSLNELVKYAKEKGYDGLIATNIKDSANEKQLRGSLNKDEKNLLNDLKKKNYEELYREYNKIFPSDESSETFYARMGKRNGKNYILLSIVNYKFNARTETNVLANDYIAFEPTQIKSVKNRGSFSGDINNIYYQDDDYEIKVANRDEAVLAEQKAKNKDYNVAAVNFFGTTGKLSEAGYILTDGRLLDLSGKNQGGQPNTRSLDHRDVSEPLEQWSAGMEEFINSGNIRYIPESDTLLMSNLPTPEQFRVIERIINNAGGEITIELMGDANRWGANDNDYYNEYSAATLTKIKRDINAFYNGSGVRAITQFFQSAFAGSRVDYNEPSLEAIGTGEGAQAHGWGLYYALDKDVAERYRENFVGKNKISFKGKTYDNTMPEFDALYKLAESQISIEQIKKDYNDNLQELKEFLKEAQEYNVTQDVVEYSKQIKETEKASKFFNSLTKKDIEEIKYMGGQVHEVDIPENPYLLDEQKSFSEQSDIVKKGIIDTLNSMNLSDKQKAMFKDNIENRRDTGKEIYEELTVAMAKSRGAGLQYSSEENIPLVSKALSENGIKGITYDGRQDGRCFVIFNPKDVKVIQKFYQRGKGSTKITPDEYIIKLLESADESTLPHEFAHYWLTEMWNYTRTGRASENYMKRWNIISDYLGVKPEQTRLTRGQQEKFASSYEAYLTRGELPTPLIASVFDDYDKWLQQVYNDYNKINYQSGFGKRRVRLTDAAIKFFQSMTTGTLEAPALAPKNTGVAIPEKTEEAIKPTNEVVETPATYETTRVINITEGQKGVSKVYQREAMKHADRIVDELGVSYNKINLEEQAVKAVEWVQNNLEEARKVVNGAPAPEGIIDTAIFIAYENEMLRIGNNAEYQRALKIHSQVQTQRGQAIAAERITTDDVYNPAYWWKKLQKSQETNVVRKLFKGDTDALNQVVETETKNLMKQIAGKPRDEQVKALSNLAKKLQKDYNLDTLYQMPDEVNEKTVKEFIKDVFGINPDLITGNEVINKAEQLQKLWDNTKDESGNPSIEAMRAKRELNDLIQAKNPSSTLAIWTSIFGRGVMLASVKSPVLNIISNIEAGVTEGITRRIMYKTTEKAVDANVKKEFSDYAWEVYKASGDIVSTMNDYDDDMRVIGEQILHSQGPGAFRAASRKVEEISFKYLMGAPDAVSKTLAFNDTADLLATKIAREEGAKDISKRATEIYKDAILIRPQTEQGQLVRQKAQEQAHYTTFTNDSWAARFGLSARNWLNMVGRNKVRLGDLTMKFVKTPANVQMMGLEYGFGSLYTLYNVQEIIKKPQSEVSQHAIRAAVRNGLGIALAALLYSMLDPEDYFSEFDTLNPKEKDRMRAMGAMPNSIKIGNRWVSLDYFGQIAIPLVGMLEARRNNGLRSYIQSGLTQAAKIPGIKETKQLIDTMSEYARYALKPEKIVQMMAGTVLDQARAMTIPAIVNDIAKMTDDYERDTMGGVFDKVISSIPGLRQTLPERYGIQGLVRTEPALSTLLFGSRVKTEQSDKLVREVEKLAGKAEQPSISDVTKYGDLRLLSPEKKVKVRKEFYKLYNSESKKLISTREYQKKDPEDKKKALNKVRSRVVKSLKEKYSNDIQREKRRQ